jgi:predicted Rdx family selenoprotein
MHGIGHIVQEGQPVLRKKAEAVKVAEIPGKEIQKLIRDMSKELASHDDGVAIAAPQIGASYRIFVVSRKVFALKKDGSLPDEETDDQDLVLPPEDLVFIAFPIAPPPPCGGMVGGSIMSRLSPSAKRVGRSAMSHSAANVPGPTGRPVLVSTCVIDMPFSNCA